MVTLLAKWIIGAPPDKTSEESRARYGALCGGVGIGLNIVLFLIKLLAGIFSGSLAITADALNNLSDAGSSLITVIGFRLAATKPDLRHPFGHGRVEYLTGLLVSAVIIVMGAELGISSFKRILRPEGLEFSWLLLGVLLCSVAVKLYMALYNRRYARALDSPALSAVVYDSLSDCVSTAAVALSLLAFRLLDWNIDAYCGLLVALFIIYGGVKSAKDTVDPLLGSPPDPDFCRKVERLVLSHPDIVGVHDLLVHDYGPGRRMISLHAEVPADGDFRALHDLIDNIEGDLRRKLRCNAVIHMDPVETENEAVITVRCAVAEAVRKIDAGCTIHDFRMVTGPTHTNLIFDLVLPFEAAMSDEEARTRAVGLVARLDPTYTAVVTVDRPYV